jgi:hypothetical protein
VALKVALEVVLGVALIVFLAYLVWQR